MRFLLLGSLTFLTLGRINDPASAQDTADKVAFFEKRVRPIFAQRCYSCHSETAGKRKGGLTLDRRERLMQGGGSGPVVVPARPKASLLIRAVRYESEELRMPPSGQLAAREIDDLVEWVRQGAVMPPDADHKTGRRTIAEGRQHWAFQPLRKAPPPALRDASWPKRPIDVWIRAGLERQGLEPSPEADRRTLIRRLTFDLIGLPPTPTETTAFETDAAPDAYARLVDRLLESPRHGERWARYWLDLARYCDIVEPWAETKGKPHLYRDWVVQAFNEDMPYDRFVRMQLAADRVPDARPGDLAALGFLGLSPTYWKELKLDKDVIRGIVAEEWEERIATVSATFLGLTVACARCHDHKHDPITMDDYYALAGVVANSRPVDRDLLPPAAAARVRASRVEAARLEAKIKDLRKSKAPADAVEQAKRLEDQLGHLRAQCPEMDQPACVAVDDAALEVLADGPYRTKLVYTPGEAFDVGMQRRGNPAQEGTPVARRFLEVLSPGTPRPLRTGSGRIDLADALVNDAAALTARVIVNRVWRHHFGRGLVETPSDFGLQGDRPSHPELLDDLAARFVEQGWSLRWLHREIVLSATYRQSSLAGEKQRRVDPENRWLGRMNRRRLDAEAWRDAILAVAGTLDPALGGPAQDLAEPGNTRRTLYGAVKRRELNDYLRLNDFPDPLTHSPARMPTTTPLQQLFTLNSPFMQRQAHAFADRLGREVGDDASARIRCAYRLAYGRDPTGAQIETILGFLTGASRSPISESAWREFAQVILGSNEFLFVD
jgi:hypothetical protein